MSKGKMAENVFRALLKELGINTTEEQGENVLLFKSDECKFTLSLHRGEDGKFDKTVLEKTSDGEEACKKFTAVVDALTELLKAFPCGDKPKDEEKSEEKSEKKSEEKSEDTPAEGKEEEKNDEGDKKEKAEEEKPAAEE